jgi:hypothetical protein
VGNGGVGEWDEDEGMNGREVKVTRRCDEIRGAAGCNGSEWLVWSGAAVGDLEGEVE